MKTTVLRWGHRPRDFRVTTHVVLTARALGASSAIISDVEDVSIENTIDKIRSSWGGQFRVETGTAWRIAVGEWKRAGGTVVHLTMYGENIESGKIMDRIRLLGKPIMVLIGSRKVPGEFFNIADFNVAVGSQPHSEVAALAVFLDRLYGGKQFKRRFIGAKIRVKPSKKGKKATGCEAGKSTLTLVGNPS